MAFSYTISDRSSYYNEPVIATFNKAPSSPEPIDPLVTATSSDTVPPSVQLKSHSSPAPVRHNTAPILRHIAPAIVAPFMKADGLVHRGIFRIITCTNNGRSFSSSVLGWNGKSCSGRIEVPR